MDVSPSIHEIPTDQESLEPMGPWRFWQRAISGGMDRWGLQLIIAWLAFDGLAGGLWALHLSRAAGWSALPNYWGELLTARDVWELVENGGLRRHPIGTGTFLVAALALVWVLWAGWQVQTRSVGLKRPLSAWLWGGLEALLLAGLPVWILGTCMTWMLDGLASTGIPFLGWLNFLGGPLVHLVCLGTITLQWWLCRVDRAASASGWNLGSIELLWKHLSRSFLRLWLHPVQWVLLVVGGTLFRLLLHFLVLWLAWRWGGGTPVRVWSFFGLQMLATGLAAWQLGWFLRLTAHYWRQDVRVRQEIAHLEALAEG